jgi:hypothetical protein
VCAIAIGTNCSIPFKTAFMPKLFLSFVNAD